MKFRLKLPWEQEVGDSNPLAPTIEKLSNKIR